jgi:lysophospholipase L1-like esterase
MKVLLTLASIMLASTCNDPQKIKTVFMGDSITDEWFKLHPDYFENKPFLNKGISGQTTAQMLARFRTDVIDEKPGFVVILGGTNDIAQNQGPVELETIYRNIVSMVEGARGNDIKVVLCSVLPARDYPWKPGMQPDKKIPMLNQMLHEYAQKNNVVYADLFSAMKDENNGMKKELARDGVHPTIAGYKVMEPILEEAMKRIKVKGER